MDKTALKAALDTFKKRLSEASKGENVGADTKAAVADLLQELNVAKGKKDKE